MSEQEQYLSHRPMRSRADLCQRRSVRSPISPPSIRRAVPGAQTRAIRAVHYDTQQPIGETATALVAVCGARLYLVHFRTVTGHLATAFTTR